MVHTEDQLQQLPPDELLKVAIGMRKQLIEMDASTKSLLKRDLETTQLNEKLREMDAIKSQFIAIASHQLRTPLSSIRWYTELLAEPSSGELNNKQREYLQEVDNGCDKLLTLVNALLNVSRIESGVFICEPVPTPLHTLAREVLNSVVPQAMAADVKIIDAVQEFPDIAIDAKLMRMVLDNLVTNAIKFTPPEGEVTLHTSMEKETLVIAVQDTGYGIPEQQKPKMFTKLFRADNIRAIQPEGNGLGLYIAHSIIEQTGGKIWFESEENKGSTFYVSYPKTGMKNLSGSKELIHHT